MNHATFTAHAKAILLGEHFVVHGVRALAIPLTSLGTTVDIRIDPDATRLHLHAEGCIPPLAPSDQALATRLVERAGELLAPPSGGRVTTRSTIPIGQGLGSSAAFAVALVGALHRLRDHEGSTKDLSAHAHLLEKIVHGTPSGIDTEVIASGRPIAYRRQTAPQRVTPGCPLHGVFASVGRPAPTHEALRRVEVLRTHDRPHFDRLIDRAHVIIEQGIDAFREGDPAALGRHLDATHALLQDLGVSTPELDTLVARARAAGAFGAKLTGAGLGGFMLALVPPQEAPSICAALRDAGATICFESPLARS